MSDFIESERERLTAMRNELVEKRHNLQTEIGEVDRGLSGLDREFEAVRAYELAKQGKLHLNGGTVRRSNATAARVPGTRKPRDGGRRESLLDMITNAPNGMSRGELIYGMNVKGNKNAEMSISNTLSAMTKSNQVLRHEGRYFATNLANATGATLADPPSAQPATSESVEAAA